MPNRMTERHVTPRGQTRDPIRLEVPNISKTAGDAIATIGN